MNPTRVIFGLHTVSARLRADARSVIELCVDDSRDDHRMRDLLQTAESVGVLPASCGVLPESIGMLPASWGVVPESMGLLPVSGAVRAGLDPHAVRARSEARATNERMFMEPPKRGEERWGRP